MLIIIDPGHGAKQQGKQSPPFTTPDGDTIIFKEWEFNQNVAKLISQMLSEENYPHMITVPDQTQVGSDLTLRKKIIKKAKDPENLKILVSIHSNAATANPEWHPANGIETYFKQNCPHSIKLAEILQHELTQKTNLKNRGIKPGRFTILYPPCPIFAACLTETGFYTNKQEVQKLISPEFQKIVAKAHVDALKKFIQSIPKPQ